MVELKDEADFLVPEGSQLSAAQTREITAVEKDLALRGEIEGAEKVQERALAGSARSHDAHHLARANGQVHSPQHLDHIAFVQETFVHVARDDQRIARCHQRLRRGSTFDIR